MLTEFENSQHTLGVQYYGISITTMEEVFLRCIPSFLSYLFHYIRNYCDHFSVGKEASKPAALQNGLINGNNAETKPVTNNEANNYEQIQIPLDMTSTAACAYTWNCRQILDKHYFLQS